MRKRPRTEPLINHSREIWYLVIRLFSPTTGISYQISLGVHLLQKRHENGYKKALHLAPYQVLHLVAVLSPAQTLVIVQVPLSLTVGKKKPQREVKRGN